jgi:hypothetical protein
LCEFFEKIVVDLLAGTWPGDRVGETALSPRGVSLGTV